MNLYFWSVTTRLPDLISKRASKHTETQLEAIEKGKNLAKDAKTSLKVHDKKDRILEERSYGNDPNPPKDKN